jgi:peptide/nickel transport system substrate-binding protein
VRRMSRFTLQMGAAAVAVTLIAGACSSSSHKSSTSNNGSSSSGGGSSALPNQIYAYNNSGTPVTGGTLTMLGVGDVDYMDPNISYYTIGYLGLREWSRQLYNYPATAGQTTTVVPDLATAMPAISDGGLKYAVTIRNGAMWDTNPPRQVTAADVVRGVERSCNPTQPFGGQPDFSDILAGYTAFCNGFANVSSTSASAQATYINDNASKLTGVTVDPTNPLTVDFTLLKPATYFGDILTLPPFAPAPVEILKYLPGSTQLAENTISDGPYKVQSYDPGKSIVFVRNPAWQASSDPLRKAYVNQIDVSETGQQQEIYQEIETNTPQADMMWDTNVPTPAIPGMISSKQPGFQLQAEFSSNPYVLFNTVSPNNGGALAKVQVRQALMYALDRTALIQDAGGPNVSPPLTHILPTGISGSSPDFDPYPYNPTKAKAMLQAAGATNLSFKFLYRPSSATSTSMFQTIQAELGALGIKVSGVGVPNSDFYTKYLEVPSVAKSGAWDLSLAGWGPDWYGDAAKSFFLPLFTGTPPVSSNFGLFSDPNLTPLINNALSATTASAAATSWHQADVEVMSQAAIFPITQPNEPQIHGTQVHNCIYVAAIQNCDPTNIWLTS